MHTADFGLRYVMRHTIGGMEPTHIPDLLYYSAVLVGLIPGFDRLLVLLPALAFIEAVYRRWESVVRYFAAVAALSVGLFFPYFYRTAAFWLRLRCLSRHSPQHASRGSANGSHYSPEQSRWPEDTAPSWKPC